MKGRDSVLPSAERMKEIKSAFVPHQMGALGIFRLYGSVLPRCLHFALSGALIALVDDDVDAARDRTRS